VPPAVIRDTILLAVVDEAYRVEAEGVASRADIDIALRLGAAHPIGPFERATELGGPAAVVDRLAGLAHDDPSLSPSGALLAAAASARRPG
jgi:3-hydroxyacyl-CoA dehydrogenase